MKAARNSLAFRRLPCSNSRRQSSNVVVQEGTPIIPTLQALKHSYANRGQKRSRPHPTNNLRLQNEKTIKTKASLDINSVMSFPPPSEVEMAEHGIDWNSLARSSEASPPARISPYPHVRFTPGLVDFMVEIPSHRDYTPMEKREIWTSLQVLRNQAKRNRTEWFWEGCDVNNVVEEDAFSCDSDGCLKHPAHLEAKKTKRRRI